MVKKVIKNAIFDMQSNFLPISFGYVYESTQSTIPNIKTHENQHRNIGRAYSGRRLPVEQVARQ
ncbi:hypothetical protein GCM10007423_45880 [Dyadobacter endophyticus]|uniref:Uncharacterized protein n=1 Tax=Dyadobacter endophyticus TaxID=1749036 RepID=A0ABQ1Z133_9BACT|nr:hypothetical protein GCM10007423_45880 [Dyadobacter endophyticus]